MRYVLLAILILAPGPALASDAEAEAMAAFAFARVSKPKGVIIPAPVKYTNGFNCGASFCGANGGKGCPSCPNGNGVCACGKAAPAVQAAPVPFTLAAPQSSSSCPNGNGVQRAG